MVSEGGSSEESFSWVSVGAVEDFRRCWKRLRLMSPLIGLEGEAASECSVEVRRGNEGSGEDWGIGEEFDRCRVDCARDLNWANLYCVPPS